MLKDVRVLVTGGAGFIGSSLVRGYLDSGASVTVVDSLVNGRAERVPAGVDFHQCDLRHPQFEALLATQSFHLVNHHAALKDVRRALLDPVGDAETNVLGTLHVLRCAAHHGVRRVILASSSAVYGDADERPTPEAAPLRPTSPYGISKTAGEHYAAHYARNFGLDCIALRYGTVFGPGMLDGSEDGAIVRFIRTMLRREQPEIFGDGEQTRDFVYVDDVARANLLASVPDRDFLDVKAGRGRYAAYNVAPGRARTINALYAALQSLTGYDQPAMYRPPIRGEIYHNHLSPLKAKTELRWSAAVAFEDGLQKIVETAQATAAQRRVVVPSY